MGSKAACTVENAPAYCSCGCLAAHSSAKKKCFSVATLLLPTRCAPPALLPRRPSWRASRPTSSALTQPSPSTSRPSTPAAASSPGPPGWRLPLPTLSGWVWAHAGWGKHGWVGWQLVSRQVRTWRRWPPGLKDLWAACVWLKPLSLYRSLCCPPGPADLKRPGGHARRAHPPGGPGQAVWLQRASGGRLCRHQGHH